MRIELQNIHKTFGENAVLLAGITTAFEQNKRYNITGNSGAGKSTLLHILAGLEEPSQGSIMIDQRTETAQYRREHIAIVFQYPYLLDDLSVLENVILKGLILGKKKSELIGTAKELLTYLGLESKSDSVPHLLSGGEKQRLALARALCTKPEFLLADEPTAHLDAENKANLMQLLSNMHRDYDVGIIMVTHDNDIQAETDVHLVLDGGKLIARTSHPGAS